ncbi:MAG: Rpn family recombination-promoting nuclease/putative transposase [Bacteroidales bacterium]|nr:Rpn family recombination-promoting nuclease/putative transposase [Bacteroidales bacterium]
MERNREIESAYIDPTFDVGFKILMKNEIVLKGFLQAMIPDRHISKLTYLDTEVVGPTTRDKRSIFDVRCEDEDGSTFVVEMQNREYLYFPDRLMTYSGDPLRRMLKNGERYDEIQPLYIVSVLNYIMDLGGEPDCVRNQLVRRACVRMDDSGTVLSNKLNYLFLQLPVVKELKDGLSFLEKFSYALRNTKNLDERPKELDGGYFDEFFKTVSRMYITQEELDTYDYMIRDEVQIAAEKEFLAKKKFAEGKAEGKAEVASRMKEMGLSLDQISRMTDLSEEAISAM